ncbi:MAG: branched-chain amino acid ABC transporter permease [Burkholderiales bacterium]
MTTWIDTVLQGVLVGGLYALFATGLSLVFGVMRLVNIAHGDAIVLGAFIGIGLALGVDVNPFLFLIAVVPVMFGAGYLLQRSVLNRTLGKDILPPLLVTFGLSIIIQNVLLELFSADARSLASGVLATQSIRLAADLAIGTLPLITFAVALACTCALEFLFSRTGLGRAFRATSDDPEAAQLQGIDHRRIYALATALAFALVAVAGVFLALRTTVTPSDGPGYLLYAFEAVIIGGLGSFWGTFAGAVILGVAQGIGYRWDPGWGVLIGHFTFLAVLVIRPQGLFPKTRG